MDWNLRLCLQARYGHTRSPSYEGVDWNSDIFNNTGKTLGVLPRMREWIEIPKDKLMQTDVDEFSLVWGSGLKWSIRELPRYPTRSPSYEGVDWNSFVCWNVITHKLGSPSYEGVDWNVIDGDIGKCLTSSPSYEGVDWNPKKPLQTMTMIVFSLVWGSGLKCHSLQQQVCRNRFSLVWGSGLKSPQLLLQELLGMFSLVWGSGLK